MLLVLKFKRLSNAISMPAYATDGASGLDLFAAQDYKEIWLESMERVLIPTGLAVEIPEGFEGQVRPRSSVSLKGLHVALGTIDSDYRGEIKIVVMNLDAHTQVIKQGDRIAQLVIAPVSRVIPVEVEKLSETTRGSSGFGSTGR